MGLWLTLGSLLALQHTAPAFISPCLRTSRSVVRLGVFFGRHFTVVTTSTVPWMTGTSVNPLLRSVELTKRGANVALLLPWLDPQSLEDTEGQAALYGSRRFSTPADQERWIREWLSTEAPWSTDAATEQGQLGIFWYPARYCPAIGSIIFDDRFRGGTILDHLPAGTPRDVAILEEPEHLAWYHNGGRWGDYFAWVIGVVHTDYLHYATVEPRNAKCKAIVTQTFQAMAYRAHCDQVVCLSRALADCGSPAERTAFANVNGVRSKFLKPFCDDSEADTSPTSLYLLAKKHWAKGYRELFAMLDCAEGRALLEELGPVHLIGSGPDEDSIHRASVDALGATRVVLRGFEDHITLRGTSKPSVFVNPSTSEVLCTATAEALAMGNAVVIPVHPSNLFFIDNFQNCRPYATAAEFRAKLRAASDGTLPLSAEERHLLGWAAATDRLAEVMRLPASSGGDISRASDNKVWCWRPTSSIESRLAHQFNLVFRRGVIGRVMHYDCYVLLGQLEGLKLTESWRRILTYLLGQ